MTSSHDETVRQTVTTITAIAGKASRFSIRLLAWTTVVCLGGLALGVAALSDGIERIWVALATVFAVIAIGGVLLATWRVGSVRRRTSGLADEVTALLGTDSTRTVIETFAVDEGAERSSTIVMSRQMHGFRELTGPGLASSPRLAAAVKALTSFPLLVLQAIAISTVFACFGVIFLLALAVQ